MVINVLQLLQPPSAIRIVKSTYPCFSFFVSVWYFFFFHFSFSFSFFISFYAYKLYYDRSSRLYHLMLHPLLLSFITKWHLYVQFFGHPTACRKLSPDTCNLLLLPNQRGDRGPTRWAREKNFLCFYETVAGHFSFNVKIKLATSTCI